jgi:cytochrome c peroxidase
MHWRTLTTRVGAGLITIVFVTLTVQAVRAEDAAIILTRAQALLQPLPQEVDTASSPTHPARVALGRMLFFDPRWTVEGNVSCVTCHQPALYGTDALARSIGVQHRTHPQREPTGRACHGPCVAVSAIPCARTLP